MRNLFNFYVFASLFNVTYISLRQIIPLLLKFKKDMPEIFDDINYNENFDKNKYAKLTIMKD